jgi:hypothetical protein
MKAGIGMNVICLAFLCIVFLTYGSLVYDLEDYQEHLFVNNATNVTRL